ncbi:hypothetical protein DFH11DRAFT_1776251 [Phellopilus nigrolimitatus]|nr:hypothetical protein DFH11DRAFT_1776251 [Phellopilus nigrolimitatus]
MEGSVVLANKSATASMMEGAEADGECAEADGECAEADGKGAKEKGAGVERDGVGAEEGGESAEEGGEGAKKGSGSVKDAEEDGERAEEDGEGRRQGATERPLPAAPAAWPAHHVGPSCPFTRHLLRLAPYFCAYHPSDRPRSLTNPPCLARVFAALVDYQARGADDGLDPRAVDEAGDVGIHDLGSREEASERALDPDDEAAEMDARRELDDIEARVVDELDAGEVAERLGDAVVLGLDETLAVAAVAQLALARAELAGGDVLHAGVRTERGVKRDGLLRLCEEGLGGGDDNSSTCSMRWLRAEAASAETTVKRRWFWLTLT